MEKKKVEIQERHDEMNIITINTNFLNPLQKEYFESLQEEIVAKRKKSC